MKMQMPLLAPMTGKVSVIIICCTAIIWHVQIKEVKIKENDSVMDEDLLLEFELSHSWEVFFLSKQ